MQPDQMVYAAGRRRVRVGACEPCCRRRCCRRPFRRLWQPSGCWQQQLLLIAARCSAAAPFWRCYPYMHADVTLVSYGVQCPTSYAPLAACQRNHRWLLYPQAARRGSSALQHQRAHLAAAAAPTTCCRRACSSTRCRTRRLPPTACSRCVVMANLADGHNLKGSSVLLSTVPCTVHHLC